MFTGMRAPIGKRSKIPTVFAFLKIFKNSSPKDKVQGKQQQQQQKQGGSWNGEIENKNKTDHYRPSLPTL